MKILILGLGQYPKGSGIAAALYFARRGDEVTVTDLKSAQELAANVKRLRKFRNVRFVLGRHDLNDVRRADLVVRNPRIRPDSPEMKLARKLGIPVESDISLFLAACPARVIGVTGTRGKSTTSTLIAEMLRAGAGLVPALSGRKGRLYKKSPIWLGGNILVSPLTFLPRVKPDDVVVLELSSWQLEATGEKGVSPAVAVWTNLMRDHLNTYSGMEEYAEAKAQIFRHQKPTDVVFLPADRSFDRYAGEAPGRVVRFGEKNDRAAKLVRSAKMKLIGEHNFTNAVMAASVALELGVPVGAIKKVLRTFKGLPNRLEVIAVKKGVTFVNDTTATTPDATLAALQALSGRGRIHLIFGGADKELEFEEVIEKIKQSKALMYLLPGTAHAKIADICKSKHFAFANVKNLESALSLILKQTEKGDIVLLSPGCASFDQFKNEFDRGNRFKRLAAKLK